MSKSDPDGPASEHGTVVSHRPTYTRSKTDDIEKVAAESPLKEKDAYSSDLQTDAEVLASFGLETGNGEGGVKRGLKQRHLSMIALGGTIGTGLFVGLGAALASAGPVSTLLAFTIMGTIVYSLMIALGEMAALFPVPGGFVTYAARFVDPSLATAQGWNFWYSYGITLPTEVAASALVIQYWDADQTINPAVWITILLILIYVTNFLGVQWYGEAEFWFSSIKIAAVVILIITSIVIDLGGGPSHDRIGFRYWITPGPMAQLFWTADPVTDAPMGGIPGSWGRFLAFWRCFINAAFSFAGLEIIGVTIGEVENPRKNVPKAIKRVFWRIVIFYVGAVFAVGLVVPYNDPRLLSSTSDASASPFVVAVDNAGIKVLPHIINAVLLIATWSAGNSDLYASGRTLYGLAVERKAPAFLRKCNSAGVPYYAVGVTALWGPLAYMGIGAVGAAQAFEYLYDLSAISIIITWIAILYTYTRFYAGAKHQGLDRRTLPYTAPFQPYLTWFALVFLLLILIFCGFTVFMSGNWDTATFVTSYISIPLFGLVWVGWKIYARTKFVSLEDMDFTTGRRALDDMDEDYKAKEVLPTTLWGRFWDWFL